MQRIKKGDTVVVISGKDVGRRSTVLHVYPHDRRAVVEGVSMMTRHRKSRRRGEQGTIERKEAFILLDKLMPVCGACKNPCRVNSKVLNSGERVRLCNKCKEVF